MKRQTILTLLVVLLVVGMLVVAVDPVAAAHPEDDRFFVVLETTGLFALSGSAAATLIPILIGYPAQNR